MTEIINNDKIKIGARSLTELSANDLLQIIMIIGCCPSLQYWNNPIITDFDTVKFSDTYVLDYHSFRKEDNLKSRDYIFFFDFEHFRYHYTIDFSVKNNIIQPKGENISFEVYRYLIKQGFYIPFDNDDYSTRLLK